MTRLASRCLVSLAVAASLAGGCASAPKLDPRYRPVQSVLEVVAMLRHHVRDDTYRFEPARDFTGRNVYRSALIRLENLERAHAEVLRAGHLDDVIAFGKGRAFERLRAYTLAAASYRRAADAGHELAVEALQSAAVCDALAEATRIGPELDRPRLQEVSGPETGDEAPAASAPADTLDQTEPDSLNIEPEQALRAFDERAALLEAVRKDVGDGHYVFIIDEELERTDMARARFFVARRLLEPDGDVRALAELQRVVTRHRDSKNANRHLLALADLYAELAEEYVEARPPESLWFDPPEFQELVDSASRLYGAVANQDGTPEKLEAARRLEAFLAFTLRVDRDRFSR